MPISIPKACFFCMLFAICALCWLLQSLPTLSQHYVENGGEEILRKTALLEESQLPSIVICNRLPYSQSALAGYGKLARQETLRSYLQEWFDPGLADSPDFEDMRDDDRQFAEAAVAQLLPNTGLKQRIEQIVLKCQDFLSSCVLQGDSLGGYSCCENVQPFLATLNGICWVFSNRTFVQQSLSSRFGIQLTIQIARNSFVSNSLTTHPGVSVYLASGDESRMAIATALSTPAFNLRDKRQTSVLVRKQIELNRKRKDCEDEPLYGPSTSQNNSATWTCIVEAAVRECSCVPLMAILWTLQGDLDSSFLRRYNVSSICSADDYANCARKYMIHTAISRTLPFNKKLRESLEYCRSILTVPCRKTSYTVSQSDELDLPQEYRNTQDFVSKFSVAYDSLEITEVIHTKALTSRQLLTILGYNFATWFVIGHLFWSMFCWCSNLAGQCQGQKVRPRPSMVISSPIQIRPQRNKIVPPPLKLNREPPPRSNNEPD